MKTDERIKEISGMKTICGFISDPDAAFLLAIVKVQRSALEEIVEMNITTALHQYGDKNKAESWSCVKAVRAALNWQPGDV